MGDGRLMAGGDGARRVLCLRIKEGESNVLLTCDFFFLFSKLMCQPLNDGCKIFDLC